MRIFVVFEGSCESLDASQDQEVGTLKLTIKDHFHIEILDDKQVQRFLELKYAGATLQDNWALGDIGITPGSTIRCVLKEEMQPILRVYCAVRKETLPVMGEVFLLNSSVSQLKSMVSLQSGFPVSAFRLTTPSGLELYNCNQLNDYAIHVGDTLRLDVWDGWTEFLKGCLLGHKQTVQRYLAEEELVLRFQQRVALYVSAFFGHLDLASWLLGKGVRADEPVGAHPYREWCWETEHPELAKCPIHAAAEAGQLLILKIFISSNVFSLDCRDPRGCSPLQLTLQHRHRECVRYLVTKLWSMVCFPGLAFPTWVYIQIKRWMNKAQRKASSTQNNVLRVPFRTQVGDTVHVDGFSAPIMTSKLRSKVTKEEITVTSHTIQDLATAKHTGYGSLALNKTASQDARVHLPPLYPVVKNGGKGEQRSTKKQTAPSSRSHDQNKNAWQGRILLPPISQNVNPRPRFIYNSPSTSLILSSSIESFSNCTGRTPRENAIYCLSLASAFTEKPWLQQLGMARTLVRRTVKNAA
ncbi:protein ANKUB1-like [Scleropages formosus]|uniref:Ankyrin repeat and ubiquitin domain containing 1 n=1 Tax=Scleropages formosus TaxID=113540 RepID=A0A8C9S0P7_SCLFO|nr:protein ANKUB1 [Scleropages formosus]